MNAYTVSPLALDAGVSVHIVRDYLQAGGVSQAQLLFHLTLSKADQLIKW